MDCNQIREFLPDLAAGMDAGTPEVMDHISSCAACAAKLQGFRQTMAMLNEWHAPEPSPYFGLRLQARLREEIARPATGGWLLWWRRFAPAISLALVVLAGAVVVGNQTIHYAVLDSAIETKPPQPGLPVLPGTAVGDLQSLEKNDLYADSDVLDELQVQDNVTANP